MKISSSLTIFILCLTPLRTFSQDCPLPGANQTPTLNSFNEQLNEYKGKELASLWECFDLHQKLYPGPPGRPLPQVIRGVGPQFSPINVHRDHFIKPASSGSANQREQRLEANDERSIDLFKRHLVDYYLTNFAKSLRMYFRSPSYKSERKFLKEKLSSETFDQFISKCVDSPLFNKHLSLDQKAKIKTDFEEYKTAFKTQDDPILRDQPKPAPVLAPAPSRMSASSAEAKKDSVSEGMEQAKAREQQERYDSLSQSQKDEFDEFAQRSKKDEDRLREEAQNSISSSDKYNAEVQASIRAREREEELERKAKEAEEEARRLTSPQPID